jgi:hypothetical protein
MVRSKGQLEGITWQIILAVFGLVTLMLSSHDRRGFSGVNNSLGLQWGTAVTGTWTSLAIQIKGSDLAETLL